MRQGTLAIWLSRIAKLLMCALILKVTLAVLGNYGDYLPPRFESGFLAGRSAYFWRGYHWAFYLHIAFGPGTLLLGMVQMSERFRLRFSKWHRNLGRLQTAAVLFVVAPSGIWMACYADTGAVAGLGFATLGAATGLCAGLGWRAAVGRRFTAHRGWMSRCFVLLCSAVVLRLIGGTFTVVGIEGDWTYALAAWASWVLPLAVYELIRLGRGSSQEQLRQRPRAPA